MQTQELHIALDIQVQKINSHWNQNFQPQEKDFFLNGEITRFINRRIDKLSNRKQEGIFDTIKRTTELSPLLITRRLPVMYKENQKEAKVLLPFDFLYYVGSNASVCCPCKGNKLLERNIYLYELDITTININSFNITISKNLFSFTVSNSDIHSNYYIEDTIPIYSNKIMFINALLIKLLNKNNTTIEITYDKVKDKFLFRSYEPFTILVDFAVKPISTLLYKQYEDINDALINSVDVVDEEYKTKVQRSFLSASKDEKSLVTIRDKELLYDINGVIADYVNLTYLRKPTKIDLLLQSNSELKDETLEEIVIETAQRMMAVMGSDNYNKFIQENTIIE